MPEHLSVCCPNYAYSRPDFFLRLLDDKSSRTPRGKDENITGRDSPIEFRPFLDGCMATSTVEFSRGQAQSQQIERDVNALATHSEMDSVTFMILQEIDDELLPKRLL